MSASVREEAGPGLALLAFLNGLHGQGTEAGVTAPDGGPAGTHTGSGEALAAIMARHEFGLGVPERAVLRPATIEARDKLAGLAAKAVGLALSSRHYPAVSEVLGPPLRDAMVDRMAGGVDPPLPPPEDGTLGPGERGPGDTPLVATGQLLHSLHWSHDAGS